MLEQQQQCYLSLQHERKGGKIQRANNNFRISSHDRPPEIFPPGEEIRFEVDRARIRDPVIHAQNLLLLQRCRKASRFASSLRRRAVYSRRCLAPQVCNLLPLTAAEPDANIVIDATRPSFAATFFFRQPATCNFNYATNPTLPSPLAYFVRFKRDLFSSFPFFQSDSEIDKKEINKRKEWRISLISNFKFRVEIAVVYKRERERGIGISFLVSFLFYFSFFFCERFNFAGRKKRFSR